MNVRRDINIHLRHSLLITIYPFLFLIVDIQQEGRKSSRYYNVRAVSLLYRNTTRNRYFLLYRVFFFVRRYFLFIYASNFDEFFEACIVNDTRVYPTYYDSLYVRYNEKKIRFTQCVKINDTVRFRSHPKFETNCFLTLVVFQRGENVRFSKHTTHCSYLNNNCLIISDIIASIKIITLVKRSYNDDDQFMPLHRTHIMYAINESD